MNPLEAVRIYGLCLYSCRAMVVCTVEGQSAVHMGASCLGSVVSQICMFILKVVKCFFVNVIVLADLNELENITICVLFQLKYT